MRNLNEIVTMYLNYAERQARRGNVMYLPRKNLKSSEFYRTEAIRATLTGCVGFFNDFHPLPAGGVDFFIHFSLYIANIVLAA